MFINQQAATAIEFDMGFLMDMSDEAVSAIGHGFGGDGMDYEEWVAWVQDTIQACYGQ